MNKETKLELLKKIYLTLDRMDSKIDELGEVVVGLTLSLKGSYAPVVVKEEKSVEDT